MIRDRFFSLRELDNRRWLVANDLHVVMASTVLVFVLVAMHLTILRLQPYASKKHANYFAGKKYAVATGGGSRIKAARRTDGGKKSPENA